MKLMSLMMSAALALAGISALAATTYTWQKTTGGDLAVEGNWSPETGLLDGQASATLTISKDQSAPITLSQDLSALGGKHYFSFSGEMKFDTPETTLTLGGGHLYLNGNGKTLKFTQGHLVNKSGLYYESGNNPTRLILSGPNASGDFQGVIIGSWQRNKSLEVEGGATFTGTDVTVGRDHNGGSNDTFKVTGTGSTATLSGALAVNNGGNNVAEIADGAELSAKEVRIGVWNKPNNYDYTLTNIWNSGNALLINGGSATVKDGPVTVGFNTCSNELRIVNGGTLTVITNKLLVGNYNGNSDGGSLVNRTFPGLGYRMLGNRVLVSGAGSRLKLLCTGNSGFWMGFGNGDDARVDIEDGGVWESAGEFKIGDGAGTNCVFRVGPGGFFTHSIHGVSIGISSTCGPMSFVVDGGTYACTNVNVTVGGSGSNARFEIRNNGKMLTSGQGLSLSTYAGAKGNVFAVTDGGYAEFDYTQGRNNNYCHSVCSKGDGATILVDNGELSASNDYFKAASGSGGKGARLIVRNGGLMRMGQTWWGDQGSTTNDCGVVISNGTVTVKGSFSLGGSHNAATLHGCWMTIGGTNSLFKGDGDFGINCDSLLRFDIPKEDFSQTPVQVKTLLLRATSTLKVTVDEKFPGGTVTLAEATNDIALPEGLKLDLPPKARLVTSDPKKLQVKIPSKGFVILFR